MSRCIVGFGFLELKTETQNNLNRVDEQFVLTLLKDCSESNLDNIQVFPHSDSPIEIIRALITISTHDKDMSFIITRCSYSEGYLLCRVEVSVSSTFITYHATDNVKNIHPVAGCLLSWLSDEWTSYNTPDEEILQSIRNSSFKLQENRSKDTSLHSVYERIIPTSFNNILNLRNHAFYPNDLLFASIPNELLMMIFLHLSAKDLFNVSCCCKYWQREAIRVTPGLYLTLYSHQLTSVLWMLQKESFYGKSLSPSETKWTCHDTTGRKNDKCLSRQVNIKAMVPVFNDTMESKQQPAEKYVVYDFIQNRFYDSKYFQEDVRGANTKSFVRGGMLCDEPGLGKTITMLAVIMRTLGVIAYPPNDLVNNAASNGYGLRSPVGRKRQVPSSQLLCSSSTLIIVPDTLLEHWRFQIDSYTNINIVGKVYIDINEKAPLPPASYLSSCSIVVTSYKRLTVEWRHGRPLCFLDTQAPSSFSDYVIQSGGGGCWQQDVRNGTHSVSPLLQIYWLRVVVDEGHQMGRSSATSIVQMASALQCERRWVLTGTPTPSLCSSSSSMILSHLQRLFQFLRHVPFGVEGGESLWKQLISRPMDKSQPSTKRLLVAVLSEVMIRHSKDIVDIPKPVWKVTHLNMSNEELSTYNTVVTLAKSNLTVTGKDYSLPGAKHKDSLLNPANRQFLSEILTNIRMSSCGGGEVKLILKDYAENTQLTIELLRKAMGDECTVECVEKIVNFIAGVTAGKNYCCEWCGVSLPLLLITPCAHFLCPECLDISGDYCEVCKQYFDWNMLQELQPGFEVSNFEFDKNPNGLLSPVPNDVDFASSSKALYLLDKIWELEMEYERYTVESRMSGLRSTFMKGPPKIIVFSQFNDFLDRIAIDLLKHDVKYVGYYGANRNISLQKFKILPNVRVLLLPKEGSLGLDLSFVTNIFLMDCIMDGSLLNQVVSRAYRMGTKQAVVVDQLVMANTIEEIMLRNAGMQPLKDVEFPFSSNMVGVTADLESFNAHDMQSERDNNNFTENKGLSGTQVTHLRQSGISSNGKLKRKRGKDASSAMSNVVTETISKMHSLALNLHIARTNRKDEIYYMKSSRQLQHGEWRSGDFS